jgi:uncharacterized iron-regulated protein
MNAASRVINDVDARMERLEWHRVQLVERVHDADHAFVRYYSSLSQLAELAVDILEMFVFKRQRRVDEVRTQFLCRKAHTMLLKLRYAPCAQSSLC